uniref:Dynein light chain Tctex-type 1 n=1 Tax=Engystomops pustulosus TaxID=76066 RepID=A0AAV6YZ88_ENGPU|nr:hypothetical protein GDO81_021484 [Engystomops pustulosus]
MPPSSMLLTTGETFYSIYSSLYLKLGCYLTLYYLLFLFQSSFVVDEVSNIIKESIESAIGGNAYQHNKVNQWTTNVVEQTLSQLTKLGKPFKYIVTCVIMQKNGAGLHTASSCFWDNATDGKFSLHLKYNHFVRLGEAGEDGQVMVACFVNVQTLHKVLML